MLLQVDIRGVDEGPTTTVLGNSVVAADVTCATEGGGGKTTVEGIE